MYILCRKDAVIFVICGPLIVIHLSNVSVEETNQDFAHVIKTDFCEISGDKFNFFHCKYLNLNDVRLKAYVFKISLHITKIL